VSDLSELLELLYDAEAPFVTLRGRFREWRHYERAQAAVRAEVEGWGNGASISLGPAEQVPAHDEPAPPPESENVLCLWRALPDRARVEYHGGSRDGEYGVRVGEQWWRWDADSGAESNVEDPSLNAGIGDEHAVLFNPSRLLSTLRFAPEGRTTRAGREVIVAEAVPRSESRREHRWQTVNTLRELGMGADRYRLEFDAERGMILAARAFRDGEPFEAIETLEIAFDEPLEDALFEFRPPEGEEVRSAGERRGEFRSHISIAEAQALTQFTVLIPERVPAGWRIDHCFYIGGSERPRQPPGVGINYRSESAHESLYIAQMSASEQDPSVDDVVWEETRAGDRPVRVRRRDEHSPQTQLKLKHAGTWVRMSSDSLTAEQLIALAATLAPAPEPSEL
jgi:hypothetical protein